MVKVLNVSKLPGPILIVAPHPDDDVLGTGGLIQTAKKLGKKIYVLYITAGDANGDSVTHFLHKPPLPRWFRKLGYVRHGEALRAEKFLGIPLSHLFFLGFPDAITFDIVTDKNMTRVHQSPTTLLTKAAYEFSYKLNAPYSHRSILKLVKSVLRKVKPETIFVTLRQDTNPDHSASHIIIKQAVRQLGISPAIYSFLIHFPNWPNPKGPFLKPPRGLHLPSPSTLLLSRAQRVKKLMAFMLMPSQFTVGKDFLSLIRRNELYWRTTDKHRKRFLKTRTGSKGKCEYDDF